MTLRKATPVSAEARSSTSLSDVAPPPAKAAPAFKNKAATDGTGGSYAAGELTDFQRRRKTKSQRFAEGEPEGEARKEKPRKKRQEPSAFNRAVSLLARREHSQVELLKKLMEREVPEEEAKAAIARLVECGLQSDQRYLESRVRLRLNDGHGPRRIKSDLYQQGLDDEAVAEAIDAPSAQWTRAAYKLIERKYGVPPLPFDLRQKALGLLIRRGFSFDLAQKVIRTPPDDREDLS